MIVGQPFLFLDALDAALSRNEIDAQEHSLAPVALKQKLVEKHCASDAFCRKCVFARNARVNNEQEQHRQRTTKTIER